MSQYQPVIHLSNSTISVVLTQASPSAVPCINYAGPTLIHEPDERWLHAQQRAVPRAHMNQPAPLCLAPDASRDSLIPALLSAHVGGRHFAQQWHCIALQHEAQRLSIKLQDQSGGNKESHSGLALHLTLTLDASGCLIAKSTLINQGQRHWHVEALHAPYIPLPASLNEALTLTGRWGLEAQQQRQSLLQQTLLCEHREGRSGPQHLPAWVVGEAGFNERHGQVIGAQLAWSGNHRCRIEQTTHLQGFLAAGEWLMPGEVSLAPGDTLESPELIVTHAQGLDSMRQRFHQYLREQVLPAWTRRARPVIANSWEAVYFDHQKATLDELVDAAQRVGAERFVLDDGWFLGRRDDTSALGDWYVDPEHYPEGLHPLVHKVRSQGMQFGLWFEPEMVSPNSELARAHPDWILKLAPYDNPQARQQWVLNIAHPEAWDYLYQRLSALIEEYRLDYIKWDMNRPYVLCGDTQGKAGARRQVLALYRLLAALTQRFPSLEIESCASGGGRLDAGILRYCGRVWASDNNDPIERNSIHQGLLLFFPPEIIGAHIGPDCAHLTGRDTSASLRSAIALQGQLGFEADLRQVSTATQALFTQVVKTYQAHRHWVSESRVYQQQSLGVTLTHYISPDQHTALSWAVAPQNLRHSQAPVWRIDGLAAERDYTLTLLLPDAPRNTLKAYCEALPAWMNDDAPCFSGEFLSRVGLCLPVMPPQSALLLSLTASTPVQSAV